MADLHQLLQLMARQHASDLFLSVGAPPQMKVEGVTLPIEGPALRPGAVRELADAVMNDRQKAAFEATLEANLAITLEGAGRFRINVYMQRGEVAMAVRLIKSRVPGFTELGLPRECEALAMRKRGLILFVGAAGSGKSTSLAAMIAYRASRESGHILTIEDPIEYLLPHRKAVVDQREVGIDTRSFGDALRNAMREAPDVIMIGEIRDEETARHAIAYSETGHLCLSTMHAANAWQAIERIVHFFPEDARKSLLLELSLNLVAVVSQRLVPTRDGKLALATDLLTVTPYVAQLIESGRLYDLRMAMTRARDLGMHTLDQSLFDLYQAGRISREEALRNADSHADLALNIRLAERHTVDEVTPFTMKEPDATGRVLR